MKRKILNIGIILLLFLFLMVLTGCENENLDINQINSLALDENNNTIILQNDTIPTPVLEENTTKQESNNIEENNSSVSNSTQNTPSVTQEDNPVIEEQTKNSTFKVAEYEFNYGNYDTIESVMGELNFEYANIIINLKKDGTYTFTSDNQNASKTHSGTWSIVEDSIILKNGTESKKYRAIGNNLFAGSGSFYLSYKN